MPAAKAPITQTGGALQEAPAPASGGGNVAAEKAWCDEPTLDDLDISIPHPRRRRSASSAPRFMTTPTTLGRNSRLPRRPPARRHRRKRAGTSNDDVRVEEFRVARAIGRDIAPEFNAIVEEEVDTLRIDTSRSRGKVQLPLPPLAEKLQTEVNEQKAIEGDLLNDPEYKLELLKQFDPMLEAAVLEPPLKLKGTESLRPTSATEKSRELQRSRLTSLGNSVADALGIPAAPTSRERLEESVGVRVMLAGKRRRAARVTKEMEELKVNEAEMRQRKRYPYKGTFRTF